MESITMRGHSRNTFLYTTQFSDSIFCECDKVDTSRLVCTQIKENYQFV